MTDCALDLPRRLGQAEGSAREPSGYGIVAGSGLHPVGGDMLSTATAAAGMTLQRPTKPKASPVLLVLSLIGLSAIGALLYIVVIHPAISSDGAESAQAHATAQPQPPAEVPLGSARGVGPTAPAATAPAASIAPVPHNGVRIVTVPPRADVYRGSEHLGLTPVVVTFEPTEAPVRLQIRKGAFLDTDLTLTTEDRSTQRTIALRPSLP